MHRNNIFAMAILALTVLSCASSTAGHNSGDAERLLALHEEVLRAHRESDVDLFLKAEEDGYILASDGEITHPDLDDRRNQFGPYLGATKFTVYRDRIPPSVQVSADGTLGWVIAQVEAKGEQTAPNGRVVPIEFVSSWIDLYEKRDARWLRVGNVSNFRPDRDDQNRGQ
jgi:hypothetical protein